LVVGTFMDGHRPAVAATADEACKLGDALSKQHASSVLILDPAGIPYSVDNLRETLEKPDD
jgi:hypothetical protein